MRRDTSHELLVTKETADLRKVLIAAHFPKRLSKKLVEETDICLAVDEILDEKFPVVTYRVLGYYVIGLTRIYYMKVKYLLDDCNRRRNERELFSDGRKKVGANYGGTRSYTFVESIRAQCGSLSLPDCFDLDSYDLDVVLDDTSNDHVKPHLELVLKDTWEDQRRVCHALGKEHASASTSTSAMPTDVELDASVEKFMHRFVLEERLDPMVLSVSDDELILDSAPLIQQEPEPELNNDIEPSMISEGVASFDNQSGDEEGTTTEPTVVSEMASLDNLIIEPSPDKGQLSVAVDVTPRSRAPVVTGKRKQRSVAVSTPASRTDLRAPRTRKCVYNYALMFPDEVYRARASDESYPVRKRRTQTAAIERKDKRASTDRFMQPEFSSFQADLSSAISANVRVVVEQVEETAGPTISKGDESKQVAVEDVEAAVGPTMSKNNEVGPLNVHMVSEETEAEVIAPLTPGNQSASLRFDEACETSMISEMGPISSCESQERMMSPIRDGGLDEIQTAESQGPSTLGEENQENVTSVLVAEKLSAATKSVGSFLRSKFAHSKEKGEEEAVNLSRILMHKTKKESATFFYQILVLKSGGYVDVTQEKPYDEICLKQTEKMTSAFV